MVCNPDVFLRRWLVLANGKVKAKMPLLDKDELKRQGVIITAKKGPSVVSEGNVEEYQYQEPLHISAKTPTPKLLVTGQIPRHTAI